jgi:3',5'-cyclic AMP phosphodiesterase CpdA
MLEVKTDTTPAVNHAEDGPRPNIPATGFSLAHISDLHLTTLKEARCSQLLNKRMLGYFSWWRKRRHIHRSDIVDALLVDLAGVRPDHVAVTGDLTHVGLPEEFAEARQWLKSLGDPDQVTVIPGNHEAYVGSAWIRSCAMWAPYLESDTPQDIPKTAGLFPSLRIRGQIALIGLCSARASLPFLAVGSLGRQQLESLATLLRTTREQGLLRIVLIHHPPVPGTIKWRKRLVDSKAFVDVLVRHGAELVLHGHTHYPTFSQIATPGGKIPVVGAPSASELNPRSGHCAKYNIYQTGSDGQLTMSVRGYSEALGRFVAEQETTLFLPHHESGS